MKLRHSVPGRQAMTKLDSIKKQRHHFVDKALYNQNYSFSSGHVWMWELDYKENWVPKNWCFWIMVLEKTLESPLDCKKIPKDISPEYSLEGPVLRLKLQYFGHLLQRTDSVEKTLMLGKMEGGGKADSRGWGGWLASPTQWSCIWVNSGSWWWTGRPGVLESMRWQKVGHDWVTELNWTEKHPGFNLFPEAISCSENVLPCVETDNRNSFVFQPWNFRADIY